MSRSPPCSLLLLVAIPFFVVSYVILFVLTDIPNTPIFHSIHKSASYGPYNSKLLPHSHHNIPKFVPTLIHRESATSQSTNVISKDVIAIMPPRPNSHPKIKLDHHLDVKTLFCNSHPLDCPNYKRTDVAYNSRVQRLNDAFGSNGFKSPNYPVSPDLDNICSSNIAISVWYDAWIYEWWPSQLRRLPQALNECPTKCSVTTDWEKAHIQTTMMEYQYTPTKPSVKLSNIQASAVLSTESYAGVGDKTHSISAVETEKADFIVSYDRRSDVFINYFYALTGQSNENDCSGPKCFYQSIDSRWEGRIPWIDDWEKLASRREFSGVFISKCMPVRQNYLVKLSEYAPFDSYGSCLHTPGLHTQWNDFTSKADSSKAYPFHFAFENDVIPDYVTEKFFAPFLFGVLMVYWGAPNIADYAPAPHSFINVLDFEGPDELGKYLQLVRSNRTLYESYFAWRKDADYSRVEERKRLTSLGLKWKDRDESRLKSITTVSPNWFDLRTFSLFNEGAESWQCRLCQAYHHRYCSNK